MTIKIEPFPLPPTANSEKLSEFGRVVTGVDPAKLSESEFKEIESLLYKVCVPPLAVQCLSASNSCSTVPSYSGTWICHLKINMH